jgi:Flp pilus assembly protein TadG
MSPSIETQLYSFTRDNRGSVAIIFSLCAIVLFAGVGGALDYGRAVIARYHIQETVDAAALAGARTYQLQHDEAAAKDVARRFYEKNRPTGLAGEVVQLHFNRDTLTLSMAAAAKVPTPFLSVIRISAYDISATSGARVTMGGTSADPVEIALMLDVTARMAGPPLAELRTAAKDFVTNLISPDQSEWTKIALAPYAEGVRPGEPFFSLAVAPSPSQAKFDDVNGNRKTYHRTNCTAERVGRHSFTAAAPVANDRLIPIYTENGRCTPAATISITPLTAVKDTLLSAIDALQAGGQNGGHIGVGWTWYLLSPDWSSVWPAASRPRPYGTVQKIAVLMTSGEWEVAYDASGVATRDSGRNANNGSSDAYSRQLCDNMKAAGIRVFTIGFKLQESRAIENMRRCASRSDMFYNTSDGVDLRVIYRDIALRVGQLRLVN